MIAIAGGDHAADGVHVDWNTMPSCGARMSMRLS